MGTVAELVAGGAAVWLAVSVVVAAGLGRIIRRAEELARDRDFRPALTPRRGPVGVVVPIAAARSAHKQGGRVIA